MKRPVSTRRQNSRSRSTRSPRGLPAISEALIAPIDVPITQSGSTPASRQRLIDAGLIGAERAAALKDEDGLAERFDLLAELGHRISFQAATFDGTGRRGSGSDLAGDQARAALEGEIAPEPAEADGDPAAEADQEPDVRDRPEQPRPGSR